MKKNLTIIGLFSLIVLFPLASWYYLSLGAEHRKQLIIDLAPKGAWTPSSSLPVDTLMGYTAIIFGEEKMAVNVDTLYSQFRKSPTFTVIQLHRDSIENRHPWGDMKISGEVYDKIFAKEKMFLIDTEKQLRFSYEGNHSEFNRMVEHIAFVLPREVQPDIKVRVYDEGE